MRSLDQKVQTDLLTPSKHLCFPQGVPKQSLGRVLTHRTCSEIATIRGFGRELDGAGGGGELAGARNSASGTLGQHSLTNGISTAHMVSPS